MRRAAIIVFALVLTAGARGADFGELSRLEQSGARISAAALDLTDNSVIAQMNPALRLTPASLTKLVVSAAALNSWPADRIFKTQLVAAGPITHGKIAGDLYLVGAGDPSLTGDNLWELAAQIKGAGITSVGGALVVTPAPFASVECETKDRCDAGKISDKAFDAPLASIGIDFGTWCIDVRATAIGEPAAIGGCSAQLPIAVQGQVSTSRADAENGLRVERLTDTNGVDMLRVGGTIPQNSSQRVYRAMSDPALGVGILLRAMLADLGIAIARGVTVRDGAPPSNADAFATTEGLSLKEQLGRMLRYSNNYIADVLTLTLAAAIQRSPPTTLSGAATTLSNFMLLTQSHSKGSRTSPPILLSGSGLTPENELSANDLVGLLAHEYRNTRNFGAFYGGLVVPRQAPFAFLRGGSVAWQDRVALKTGTMNMPHSVCGVAGYLRKRDGGWIAFTIIVNGGVSRMKHVPMYKSMAAIRADIEQLLARY